MGAPNPARISLELDRGSDPITGCLRDENDSSQPFTGWIGLLAVLADTIPGAPALPATSNSPRDTEGTDPTETHR